MCLEGGSHGRNALDQQGPAKRGEAALGLKRGERQVRKKELGDYSDGGQVAEHAQIAAAVEDLRLGLRQRPKGRKKATLLRWLMRAYAHTRMRAYADMRACGPHAR